MIMCQKNTNKFQIIVRPPMIHFSVTTTYICTGITNVFIRTYLYMYVVHAYFIYIDPKLEI